MTLVGLIVGVDVTLLQAVTIIARNNGIAVLTMIFNCPLDLFMLVMVQNK